MKSTINRNGFHSNRASTWLTLVVAIALSDTLQQVVVHAAPMRTVALTGQPAPDTTAGATFETFGSYIHPQDQYVYGGAVLNDAGQIAFRANLTGTGVDSANYQGIWSEGSGSLSLVARTGSQAPGAASGVNFSTDPALELYFPVLNDAGQTAFYGALTDGGLGLWSEGSGSLAHVARSGEQAPGTPAGVTLTFGNFYNHLDAPVLNNAGQSTFRSSLSGPGVTNANDFGRWSERSGGLELVARRGGSMPGLPTGVVNLVTQEAGLNDAGQTLFYAALSGSGVNSSNNRSVWSDVSGSLALVARKGDAVPGMPGVTYGNVYFTSAINNAGQTAFVAGLSSDNSQDDQESLWLVDSGNFTLLARYGDQAPGTPTGVTFEGIGSVPAINDAGQILFDALLTGNGVDSTNNGAAFLSDAHGNVTLVQRKGDQAPSTAAGTVFAPNDVLAWVLNDAGQVATRQRVAGAGVDSTNDLGIWATDRTGALQLIVRKGDELEVAPGDRRTISELTLVGASGNSSGFNSGFNNLGQLAFWASFADGTQGVFLSNEVGNFGWRNLTKVQFFGADLTGADLTGADARGITGLNLSGVTTTNLIHPDGHIDGLNLAAGQKLVAYAGVPIPVKVTGEFSVATGATFDITDNAAIVDYSGTSPAATVRDKVLSGRGGAGLGKGWNGMGITSSAAATANTTEPESRSVGYAENSTMPLGPYTEFHGTPVDGTSILMAFTRTGDANLDGVVNDDDVTIIGATYAPGVPQPSWALGDFDYNGFVDDADVTLLGAFYDPSAAPLVPPAEPGASVVAVPEPGTIALLAAGLIAIAMAAVVHSKPC
jgi:hypothetical protein